MVLEVREALHSGNCGRLKAMVEERRIGDASSVFDEILKLIL